ncbi:hypothetical protein ADL27_25450, partial [Streptomyces sp. NRRL F-6602]
MRLHEGARAPDAASLSAEYDLVVAADGAGSTIRTALALERPGGPPGRARSSTRRIGTIVQAVHTLLT